MGTVSVLRRRPRGHRDQAPLRTLLLGSSPAMAALREDIVRFGRYPVPVLIQGPTGSGKELVARGLHMRSPRARKVYVSVNCATLEPTLAASTLFGHVRGAFTGASTTRKGLFAEADGGTLFLDEVAELPLPVQAMLLRILETGYYRSVGSDRMLSTDVRILAATHKEMRSSSFFRSDLYHRLAIGTIRVPPLDAHKEDIPELARVLLSQAQARYGIDAGGLTDGAVDLLLSRDWPGNVRELRNTLIRAGIVAGSGLIDAEAVRWALEEPVGDPGVSSPPRTASPRSPITSDAPGRDAIRAALVQANHNKKKAASLLGISRSQLYARMHDLQMDLDQSRFGSRGPRLVISESALKDALREAEGNLTEAGKILNVSRATVADRIERFGLKKPAPKKRYPLAQVDRAAMLDALGRAGGNVSEVARRYGVHPSSVRKRMKKLGLK